MKNPSSWDDLDETLQPYFRALQQETPEVETERLARARADYQALIQRLRPSAAERPRAGRWTRVRRWAWALALVLLLLWQGGVLLVRAAEQARPGTPLYAIKRWEEAWQLQRARTPSERIRLHQQFAQRRIYELRQMLGRNDATLRDELLNDLLGHINALARLAHRPAKSPTTELTAEIQALIPAIDPTYRQALLQALNTLASGQRLTGVLRQRQGNVWLVDDITVVLTPDTLVQGLPQPGDVVEIMGASLDEQRWQAHWVRVAARGRAASPTEVTVVGQIEAVGDHWEVNGHFFVPRDAALAAQLAPHLLAEVRLRWDPAQAQWVAIDLKPQIAYKGRVREISGLVEDLAPGRVRLNGRWWSLGPETEIEGTLQIGVPAHLEAWQDAQGHWHVVEIEVQQTDDEQEHEDEDNENEEEENETEEEASHILPSALGQGAWLEATT